MESKQTTSSNRLLALMGVVLIGLIVVVAIVVAFREPAQFDPGTPEAAVQDYLTAVLDEDSEAAHALLTPGLRERCDERDLEDRYYRNEGGRITLQDSRVDEATATVEIEFTATYGDSPFDFYEYSYDERFELEMTNGDWLISEPPWPYYWCPEG